jgi:hypothetical protein
LKKEQILPQLMQKYLQVLPRIMLIMSQILLKVPFKMLKKKHQAIINNKKSKKIKMKIFLHFLKIDYYIF